MKAGKIVAGVVMVAIVILIVYLTQTRRVAGRPRWEG